MVTIAVSGSNSPRAKVLLFIFAGMAASYTLNLPTGPVIIRIAAVVYLVTSLKRS